MIELVLRFKAISFFYITLVVTALCILWAYATQDRRRRFGFWPVIWANFALFTAWGFLSELNHDDVAFMHFSWLISRGLVPFRDFWEHHSPLLPVLLSRVMKIAPRSPVIYDMARIFSGCLFAANCFLGWRISRTIWKDKADLSVYLLIISSVGIFAHYLLLRPDLFMMFFMLCGVAVTLDIPRGGIRSCFLAGIAFGIAVSFIAKQYLLVFLPVIAVIAGSRRGRMAQLAAYAGGFLLGIVPLVTYLISNGIVRDFLVWVVRFNGKALQVNVHFPVLIGIAGTWGVYALFRRFKSSRDISAAVLVGAFCLSTLSSLTTMSDLDGLYYLGLWYFLCAIAACGAHIPERIASISVGWKRTLLTGLVCGALVSPNVAYIWKYRAADFFRDKIAAAELMKYAADRYCVVVLPIHPVFSYDATRLYSGWQYYFTSLFRSVRDDVRGVNIAHRIMALRPSVVQSRYSKRDFILELYQKKLISANDYKALISFLTTNYIQHQIGDEMYYISADALANHLPGK